MAPFIDLQRRFHVLTASELGEPEHLAALNDFDLASGIAWTDLLRHRRVVLLAEAGAGKTREMMEQARRLAANNCFAIFVPLEGLARHPLRDLVSVEDERRIEAWKTEGHAAGYFFLDAVDELKLTEGRLDQALLQLARSIDGHLDRAHIVVSCRPSDWRPGTDQKVLEHRLPVPTRQPPPSPSPAEEVFLRALRRDAGEEPARPAAVQGSGGAEVQTVILLPMSDRQIRLFAEHSGAQDANAFLAEVARQNAWTFARRPLDLTDLVQTWVSSGRLGTRAEQHEANVQSKLRDNPERRDRSILSDAKARDGAERLALGLALTKTRTIRSLDQELAPERAEGVLDPVAVLPDWTEAERQALLRRALFDPATYGRVRFHHRSVQEYLAAHRLRNLRERGMSIKALFRLLFANRYGVDVVFPSMRAIAAWLALWIDEVRTELTRREPEVLLLFGDPETLSLEARGELVTRFVEAYGEGGWRGFNIPLDEVRRLAHPELGPVVRRLWGDGPINPDIRELLISIIWQGRIGSCADLARTGALATEWPAYDRVVAVRALVECGEAKVLREVAKDLMTNQGRWPDRAVFYVAEDLFPDLLSLDELIVLMQRTREPQRTIGGFGWATRTIVEKLDPASEIAIDLRDRLANLILGGRAAVITFYDIQGSFDHLAPALAILCKRQLDASRGDPDPAAVRAAVIASRFGENEAGQREPVGDLRNWFQTGADRRRAAFWAELAFMDELALADDPRERLFRAEWHSLVGELRDDDAPWLETALTEFEDDARRTVALHALIDIWHGRQRPDDDLQSLRSVVRGNDALEAILQSRTQPAPFNEQHERWERERIRRQEEMAAREDERLKDWREWRQELLADPDGAFSPTSFGGSIANVYMWLRASAGSHARFDVWDSQKVVAAFGPAVGDRIRAAFRCHWRSVTPETWSRRPPAERNSTPYSWIQGLCGLSAEAETPGWAADLTSDEARLAAVYSMLELNGFASFLPDLAAAWPAEVEAVIGEELAAEVEQAAHHSHLPVLQNLSHADQTLKQLLAPRLLASVLTWPTAGDADQEQRLAHHLGQALSLLSATTEGHERSELARACEAQLERCTAQPMQNAWVKGLFRLDAERAAAALGGLLGSAEDPEERSRAVSIFAHLFGEHGGISIDLPDPSRRAQLLGQLVRTVYAFVRRQDDITHEGTYTPDTRDEAQTARNRLLSELIDTPGDEARHVLLDLANEPDFAHFSDRLRLLARQRAATDAEFPPFAIQAVVELESRYEAPPHDRDGLFAVMLDRLDDLAHSLRHGDFTDRRTLRTISEEPEMQRTLAARLEANANGAYVVVREEEVADNKLPDIRLAATRGDQRVVAEVKIADSWSPAELEHALEHQLVGQYLRHDRCRAGCLLLTNSGTRAWNHPTGGGRMTFQDLVDHLNGKARDMEERARGRIRIRVVGIDLTDPELASAHR